MRIQNKHHNSLRPLGSIWLQIVTTVLLLGGCAQIPVTTPPSNELPDGVNVESEAEAAAAEASAQAIPEPQEDPEPDQLYEWNGTGRKISHVVIDTNEQRARFYDGQEQVGWTTIASGVSAHPTPSGEFQVMEKVAKKRSNLYGRIYNAKGGLHKRNAHSSDPVPAGGKFVGARMPHFMRMTYDGIGMHAGAIPSPGQPASHGCIRLPDTVASSLFAHADIGTRVTVIGSGPDYGNYAERIRRQREQEKLNRIATASSEPRSTSSGTRSASTASSSSSTKRASTASERSSTQPATNADADSDADADASSSSSSKTANADTAATPARGSEPTSSDAGGGGSSTGDSTLAGAGGAEDRAAEMTNDPQTTTPAQPSPASSASASTEATSSGSSQTTAQETSRSTASEPEPAPASERKQASDPEPAAAQASEPADQSQGQSSTATESAPAVNQQPAATPQANTPSPAPQPLPTAPPARVAPKAPEIRSADGAKSSDGQG